MILSDNILKQEVNWYTLRHKSSLIWESESSRLYEIDGKDENKLESSPTNLLLSVRHKHRFTDHDGGSYFAISNQRSDSLFALGGGVKWNLY